MKAISTYVARDVQPYQQQPQPVIEAEARIVRKRHWRQAVLPIAAMLLFLLVMVSVVVGSGVDSTIYWAGGVIFGVLLGGFTGTIVALSVIGN